jgi:hypothetical protein
VAIQDGNGRVSLNLSQVLQALVILAVAGLASMFWQGRADISELSKQVALLTYKVDSALSDRYTGSDARKDLEIQKNINSLIEQRLNTHSGILTRQQSMIDDSHAE